MRTWCNVSNLAEILAFERKEPTLWRDKTRLPADYYQIAQRVSLDPAVQLLFKDLLQVRMDKLRQQFQDLLKQQQQQQQQTQAEDDENLAPPPLVVEITGMGSAEIALLQKTVQHALRDQDKLRATVAQPVARSTAKSPPCQMPQRTKVQLAPCQSPPRTITSIRFT